MAKDRSYYINEILKLDGGINLQFLQRQDKIDLKTLFISKCKARLPYEN